MIDHFIISFIKIFFMNIAIFYTILKIKKYKMDNFKTIITALFSIIIALTYSFARKYTTILVLYPAYYYILITLNSIILNLDFWKSTILVLNAITLSMISFFFSATINFLFMTIIRISTIEKTIIEFTIIGIIQLILIYLFFKIRRFKDGFSFLEKNTIKICGVLVNLGILIISLILGLHYSKWIETILILGFFIISIIMIYWLRKSITKHYKERMKDRTVELQSEQLKEKDEIISNLNQELSNVLEINHKYNKRLSAMEKAIGNFGDKLSFNEEFAKEYSDILDSLKDLSKEYKQEFENYNILPKTNIFSIDNLLDYMKTEAIRNNIEFELEINENINELIEKHISKSKLETLLGDHITDAITAINATDNSYKKIKVIIGKDKEFYKISVLDTGIEFEIETLLKLGLERITTHKDSGGTGIGFMTTFETLKECKASLVIEEYNNEKDYTKSVNVIFDGKSEYNINSYRAEKINYKTRIIQ